MKPKKFIRYLIILILLIDAGVFTVFTMNSSAHASTPISQTAAVKSVDSAIIVDGSVTAQNEAILHFQTPGKLATLPVKEGDQVKEGQTIAQLDTYDLQQQLTEALNSYRSTRDQFDQSQINSNNNVTQNTQRGQDNFYGAGLGGGSDPSTTNYLNDVAKRIVDENQANLDNSVINVQVANYALQMATLTSPLTGIVTHEDVNVAGQNVTTSTGFTVADPTTKVFRANIPASDIDFVKVGMKASVILDGENKRINGTIIKIYPEPVANLSNSGNTSFTGGQDVYQVDIQSNQIVSQGKFDQTGTAVIMTNAQNVMLIPAWTVLADKYVWVDTNGKPELKQITVGKIHGNDIEVTGGLTKNDRVITDPKAIPSSEYPIL
jgi:membrane fusion protein, antimicrobial resistance system